jgi:hypothetical protein
VEKGSSVTAWFVPALFPLPHSLFKLNEDSSDADFLNGKVPACRFFFEREIPRIDGWVNSLLSEKSVLLDIGNSGF